MTTCAVPACERDPCRAAPLCREHWRSVPVRLRNNLTLAKTQEEHEAALRIVAEAAGEGRA